MEGIGSGGVVAYFCRLSALLAEPVSQLLEFGGQGGQLGNRALAALQYTLRNGLGLVAQRAALRREGDAHTALVLHIAQPGDLALCLQALEQWRERAGVEKQALAKLGHGHAVLLP